MRHAAHQPPAGATANRFSSTLSDVVVHHGRDLTDGVPFPIWQAVCRQRNRTGPSWTSPAKLTRTFSTHP